jgi:hypothetical protein
VALLALAAGAAGCGADDEPSAETLPDPPELTVPRTDPIESDTVETQEQPTETVPPETEAPPPTETTPPADTPTSDTPPPPNSPAERFEDFCNENPGACG